MKQGTNQVLNVSSCSVPSPFSGIVTIVSAVLLIEVTTGAAFRVIEVNRGINAQFVAHGYQRFISQPLTASVWNVAGRRDSRW
jgi:hypothetical protein